MGRPIWTGTLSFGLLNVPVSLMPGERSVDLHFRLLDSRSNTPVRYERVNAETGEEVPWKEIVKAFEYEKGSYVVLEPEDIKSAASEGREAVEVEAFVDVDSIGPEYFEKPYVLVPAKKAEKGYVLLREALAKTGRVGIARVVIRTREHLCAVMPYGNALLLLMMRYPQELVDFDEYAIPEGAKGDYRITAKELAFSEQLIETMSGEFDPADYRDEFRERLHKVIDERMKAHGVVRRVPEEPEAEEGTATNVVDFMALLQKSIDRNKRTPAKKSAVKRTPDKPAKAAKAARKAPTKKTVRKAPSKAARKRA
jgi:DNA end-binding protein Ku